jgi:hypothetical protein
MIGTSRSRSPLQKPPLEGQSGMSTKSPRCMFVRLDPPLLLFCFAEAPSSGGPGWPQQSSSSNRAQTRPETRKPPDADGGLSEGDSARERAHEADGTAGAAQEEELQPADQGGESARCL